MGDRVPVGLRLVDPAVVRLPEALADALAEAPDLEVVWQGLSAGTRRGFAQSAANARRAETVARRVAEVMAALEGDAPSPSYPARRRRGAPDNGA